MEYAFYQNGERHTVEVKKAGDAYVVTALDRTEEVELRKLTSRSFLLVTEDGTVPVDVVLDGRRRLVMLPGCTFVLEEDLGRDTMVRETVERFPAGLYELKAPMPGRVVRVLARPGDYAERGRELAILEAMKMENAVPVPASAMVLEVLVQPGDLVEAGEPLLIFEVF